MVVGQTNETKYASDIGNVSDASYSSDASFVCVVVNVGYTASDASNASAYSTTKEGCYFLFTTVKNFQHIKTTSVMFLKFNFRTWHTALRAQHSAH